ncbi:MAG: aminoacyl-tRNA hydrolase [Clostridiales bacterium]|nr:aminoacyl-tRNA hydrolase [Clostridiales bacterium]
MLLIFGLGNKGKEYDNTYHNIGFKCLDSFLKKQNLVINKNKCFGDFSETNIFGEKVLFIKPTTFMNNSGECVLAFIKKFKVSIDDILIIYDDFDLPIKEVRFRNSGSSGTHNGMRDIVRALKTENFKRLRIGIKENNVNVPIINYVLSKIKSKQVFEDVFENVTNEFIENFIKNKGNVENTSLKLV